ncbi:MAG: peptidase S10 [Acidobacteriia bacterium]|nr:peptidase S10 [Terriglobia bacterium]
MQKFFRLCVLGVFLFFGQQVFSWAQAPERPQRPAEQRTQETRSAEGRSGGPQTGTEALTPIPKEESSVTEHSIRIGGQTIPYKATAGTINIKNEQDETTASIFYIAYTRSDVKDLSRRPLSFLYNGGPGSSSAWCHMGAFGPRRVVTVDAADTGAPPYEIVDNADSPLDVSDLVFIDPVGTGFSKAVGKSKDKDFWGVDQDIASLAEFVRLYVTRNDRWNSPKFLIGESYGTFRSVALSNYLQSHDGMYFNGVDLVSSVLNLNTITFHPGEDMPYIFYLPSYAATAWYHKVLKDRPANLSKFLDDARHFAATEYADALMKGSAIDAAEKEAIAKKISSFTGLSADYVMKANLRVNLGQFREELQRSRGLSTGRLDARFSGPIEDLLAESAGGDAQSAAVTGAFTAIFNRYVREELKFGGDREYHLSARGAGQNWDWKHNTGRGAGFGFPGAPNVMADMVQAMIANTHLRFQVENGYFDLATPFFATEHTMEHLGLPASLQSHIKEDYYESGHMMYLHEPSLAQLKKNIAAFIESAK